MHRRHYLTSTVLAALASLSGCLDSLEETLGSQRSLEEIKEDAEQVPYDELYRNISEYQGQAIYYPQIRISDVVADTNASEYIYTVPGGDFNDSWHLYGHWDGDPYRDGDTVELWGVIKGMTSYQSLVGEQNVPEITVREMVLL